MSDEGRGTEAVPAPFCPAPQTAVSNLVQGRHVGQLRQLKVGKDNVETADCHFSCCYALICLLFVIEQSINHYISRQSVN